MQIICLGLLLFGVTWAAPTFQPQAEKTKEDCVEEQRQEEKNKDNIVLHNSDKRRNQEPEPKENIVQEGEKNFSIVGANENNQSSKTQTPFENRQTTNEDNTINNKENAHSNQKMSIYPESTGKNGVEDGDNAVSKLRDQEEYTTTLIRNNMHHIMKPGTMTELLAEENKENKPRNVLSKIPASVNYVKAPSKDRKNYQRDPQAQNIPFKSKTTHLTQYNTDYPKQLPKLKKIPSDFEGSGYPDFQERGDNDISPFSGDGQPFKDISGKGEPIGPDLKGTDIQTEFSSPSEADAKGPGYNEIPEKEENGRNTIGTRGETRKEANTADISLVVEGSNDIIGSTNFKELPGREGNRVDTSSQNAHQGKVELHYPHPPSKGKKKEGSSNVAESTNHNEIPKNGKGSSSRKGTVHSNRNQAISNEKQRFPGKGKSQGWLVPSRDLDNDIRNEIGSHNGLNNEGTIITQSRKNHYIPHRQNSTWNKDVPQRKGSWGYRKPHSSRRVSPSRKHDSSDSSDSGSSSESDGD
uniref:Matrix extracellular phosphoglycoprotein n=1 Tax=Suricata suricatta TaxID=37032 RepID=A0A673V1W1_SURSU